MKKNILFLSIFLPLSIHTMGERAAAAAAATPSDELQENCLTPEIFDAHSRESNVSYALLQSTPGRDHLLRQMVIFTIAQDSLAHIKEPNTSVISTQTPAVFMRIIKSSPIPGSTNPLIILSKDLARLEAFLITQNGLLIDEIRKFESARCDKMILLGEIVKKDNPPYLKQENIEDLLEYFRETHKLWPPLHSHPTKRVFSHISAFHFVKKALDQRTRDKINEKNHDDYEYTFCFKELRKVTAADAKTE